MSGRVALAVDVGGTKLAAAVIDEDGLTRAYERIATPPASAADELCDALRQLC